MSAPRLLLCDLDDTLIDRRAAIRRWAAAFAARYGLPAGAADWLERADRDGSVDRHTFFSAARERFGLRAGVEALVADYAERMPRCVRPPAGDGLAALRRLRAAGWRLGVVTNGPGFQVAKMRQAGLLALVDGWCISDVDGVRKPDPAAFHLAAARCGAGLESAWMIGDSGPADVGGAVAAGLPCVWLRHGRTWAETDYLPTFQADTLAQAIGLIEAHDGWVHKNLQDREGSVMR